MNMKPKAEEPARRKPSCLDIDKRYFRTSDIDRLQAAKETGTFDDAFSDELTARAFSQPEVRAARTIQSFEGDNLDINAVADELRLLVAEVQGGSMKRPEAMLVAQAHVLDALFSSLAMRAHANSLAGYTNAADTYLRLALKAQGQAVRTIEVLGELKNPRPVTFVRQANVAHNQQVNNHPSHAGEDQKATEQTISGATHELLPDSRTSGIESTTYPPVATMETIDRTNVRKRKRKGSQKPIQGRPAAAIQGTEGATP